MSSLHHNLEPYGRWHATIYLCINKDCFIYKVRGGQTGCLTPLKNSAGGWARKFSDARDGWSGNCSDSGVGGIFDPFAIECLQKNSWGWWSWNYSNSLGGYPTKIEILEGMVKKIWGRTSSPLTFSMEQPQSVPLCNYKMCIRLTGLSWLVTSDVGENTKYSSQWEHLYNQMCRCSHWGIIALFMQYFEFFPFNFNFILLTE